MATVVAIMDEASFGANTDVLVVAEPRRERLLWVPRDLWCERLGDRVNRAYAMGGHERLVEALAEHAIEAEHSLCLLPPAIGAVVDAGLSTVVPVREAVEFRYGGRWIRFQPPAERLHGIRVHAWIGARRERGGRRVWMPDLDRIERQKQLLAVLLGERFDFSRFLAQPGAVRSSGDEGLAELAAVTYRWRLETLRELRPETIDGKEVLVR